MNTLPRAIQTSPALLAYVLLVCTGGWLNAADPAALAVIDQRVDSAWQMAGSQAVRIIDHIEARSLENSWDPYERYPSYTENELIDDSPDWADGEYRFSLKEVAGTGWADGAWPGWLWLLSRDETDPTAQAFWEEKARAWSAAMLASRRGDMLFAYLLPTQVWLETEASPTETVQLSDWILGGALEMIVPFSASGKTGAGTWLSTVGPFDGAYGYWRKADVSDNQYHFHMFIDHMVTTELMLYGADLLQGSDPATAALLRSSAISHVKTVDAYSGANRLIYDGITGTGTSDGMPRQQGSWQRGYFSYDPAFPLAPSEYLWSEPKQGWNDWSTWARGHAWFAYGCAITYARTGDPDVLAITRRALDFFINQLPPNSHPASGSTTYVPKWDFDYALDVDPDTRYDSSAGAIFLAAMVRFLSALPASDYDFDRYTEAMLHMFSSLTEPEFLAQAGEPSMSLLKQGNYHDSAAFVPSNAYDNGLIWGDYFFVQAMADYRNWRSTTVFHPKVQIALDSEALLIKSPLSHPTQTYQLEVSPNGIDWDPYAEPKTGNSADLSWSLIPIPETGPILVRVSTAQLP